LTKLDILEHISYGSSGYRFHTSFGGGMNQYYLKENA